MNPSQIAEETEKALEYYHDKKQRVFIIQSAIDKATEKLRERNERLSEDLNHYAELESRAARASEHRLWRELDKNEASNPLTDEIIPITGGQIRVRPFQQPAHASEQGANTKRLIELLRSVHTWFMQQAPERYNGCGLWIDVDEELAGHPRKNCILNVDSPTLPPEKDEYLQCGCVKCRAAVSRRAKKLR